MSENTIQERIDDEIQAARAVCDREDSTSSECAAAWDAVEELQAEAAHQKQDHPPQTNFEKYCSDNPDAAECRVYDD